MAKKSRIDAPWKLHHIIVRGIERRSIFVDAQDYENFLDRLGKILSGEIKSQKRRRAVARSRPVISIVAIEQMGFSGADVARNMRDGPARMLYLLKKSRYCLQHATKSQNRCAGCLASHHMSRYRKTEDFPKQHR